MYSNIRYALPYTTYYLQSKRRANTLSKISQNHRSTNSGYQYILIRIPTHC